jgi:hemoglobin
MTTEQSGPRALDRRKFLKGGAGVAVFGGLFLVVGCGGDDDDEVAEPGSALKTAAARPTIARAPTATAVSRPTTGTLYERLGSNAGITALIGGFLPSVALDARINTFFAAANPQRLSALLVEQIANLSGGPEKYTGRTMKETHATMRIQKVHFDALIDDLTKAMQSQQIPEKERGELLALLNPMATDIITN